MTASVPGLFSPQQFTDAGALASGYRLYTYAQGTTTQKNAYTDKAGTIPHTYISDGIGGQYIALNARGELPAPLYLEDTAAYDIALKRHDGSTVWTRRADSIRKQISVITDDLASTSKGASMIAFSANQIYASGTVGASIKDRSVSVKDFPFLSYGDGVHDDTERIRAAVNYAASIGSRCFLPDGNYNITGSIETQNNCWIEWAPNAWIKPSAHSVSGAIITNVRADTSDPAIIQSNVTLVNPQIDGINLPGTDDENGIGFARGMSKLRVIGGHVKNFPLYNAAGGLGGKGIQLERGVSDAWVDGMLVESCFIAYSVQGTSEVFVSGAEHEAQGIMFGALRAENCGAAFAAMGVNASADPDGDPSDMWCSVDTLLFHNCGHAPDRSVTSDFQKSGAIVLGEAQGITIRNVKGWNDSAYPTSYPASGANKVGEGLSGPIGAVVWGWGRNVYIDDVEYNGACDSLVAIRRARALGEDAGPTGKLENVYNFNVDNIKHIGIAGYVLSLDSNASLRPTVSELTGHIGACTDMLSSGICASELSTFANYYLTVTDQNRTVISGSANNVQTLMNTFSLARAKSNLIGSSDYATIRDQDLIRGKAYTLADDTAVAISIPGGADAGVIEIVSTASLMRAFVSYRASAAGAQCVNMGNAVANFAVATGTLGGATGTDNNFTVSAHTDGKVYCENRKGGSVTFNINFLS